ncbi:hypothetical protein BGX38DRAFT_1270404 [Terfezia claveryi]|nr:hypothetical protein BGX38DRAFT_1270404 [Terfezia claveryi]
MSSSRKTSPKQSIMSTSLRRTSPQQSNVSTSFKKSALQQGTNSKKSFPSGVPIFAATEKFSESMNTPILSSRVEKPKVTSTPPSQTHISSSTNSLSKEMQVGKGLEFLKAPAKFRSPVGDPERADSPFKGQYLCVHKRKPIPLARVGVTLSTIEELAVKGGGMRAEDDEPGQAPRAYQDGRSFNKPVEVKNLFMRAPRIENSPPRLQAQNTQSISHLTWPKSSVLATVPGGSSSKVLLGRSGEASLNTLVKAEPTSHKGHGKQEKQSTYSIYPEAMEFGKGFRKEECPYSIANRAPQSRQLQAPE